VDSDSWVQHGHSVLTAIRQTQQQPPIRVVLATGLAGLVLVAWTPVWRLARNVVTIAHEGGHAIVALAAGRTLDRIRLHSDTSGVTVSRGKPYGAGMVFTALAGYPAPSAVGLAGAALLSVNRITLTLWLAIVLLAALLMKIRNAYGALSVLCTGGGMFAVSWFGTDVEQATLAYLGVWFLLLSGIRPVWELQRARRYSRGSDADQLAALTRLPAGLWVLVFGVLTLAAAVVGVRLLVAGADLHTL
jgi:hypothetical protein